MRKKLFFLASFHVGMCGIVVAQCSCAGGVAGTLSETGLSGLLLGKNQWLVDISTETRTYINRDGASSHDHHDHVHTSIAENIRSLSVFSAGVRYGVSDKVTVIARQNMVNLVTDQRNLQVLGDLSLFSSLQLYAGCKFSLVGIAGMELPVGKPLLLNDELQPAAGSGSWDPLLGFSMNYKFTRSFIRLLVSYKYNTTGFASFKAGSVNVQQLVYNYSLIQKNENDSMSNYFILDAQAVLLSELQGSQLYQQKVINSGSYTLNSGVSMLAGYKKVRCIAGFFLPVYQQLYGSTIKLHYTFKVSVAIIID